MMKNYFFICTLFCALFAGSLAHANISSVTLTAAPPTFMSDGRSYYAAGVAYTFRVQATDIAATGKPYWSAAPGRTILVTFPGGNSFYVDLPADAFGGTGISVVSVTDNSGGTYTSIDYTIVVRFQWTTAAQPAANNNIIATVTANAGATTGNDTRTFNFGIVTEISILNFAQSGDAADARVSPWNNAFNVTGRVVYFSIGQGITTPVSVGADGIASVSLNRTKTAPVAGATTPTGIANGAALPDIQFTVGANHFIALGGTPACLGDYRWDMDVTMSLGTTETAVNPITLNCDEIQINSLTFENGGGVNTPPYNMRSGNPPFNNVTIRLNANMRLSGTAMVGNAIFTITDSLANTYTILVNNNQNQGTVLMVTYPVVGVGTTLPVTYTVTAVSGSAYDNGQNVAGRINTIGGPYLCYWDNADPPGGAPFTTLVSVSQTAASFTLNWTPLVNGGLPAPPPYDADFDSYRIYFRVVPPLPALPGPFSMVDKTTIPTLGTIGTGIATITGLLPLTRYEYRLSAIDVFGSEVIVGNMITGFLATNASTVQANITDGISTYSDADFNNPNPAAHKVRQTAIKVSLYVVITGGAPDQVNIIIAGNDSDMPVAGPGVGQPLQYGLDSPSRANSIIDVPLDAFNVVNLVDNVSRWRIPCPRTAPNTYEGYIPSDHPLMQMNSNIRFIVETKQGANSSYADHSKNPPLVPPPRAWENDEWRFQVSQPAVFIPWPTRVLNNVMTRMLPCCYPAYFLVADSLVTIKVHDVKGRVIATLADKMYRPGGQNIKEGGWCGYNKDNNRAGPGLYYIHIRATSYGNKVVLDKMMKVVIRH